MKSDEKNTLKRKPSDKVLKLTDEILSLSLIEAADLCDLCQEKLSEGAGGPMFPSPAAVPGRSPFPHPSAMFAGLSYGPPMPQMTHPMQASNIGAPVAEAPDTQAPTQAAGDTKKKAPVKENFNIKLVGYEASKKVAVVKEVRAMTGAGLKEAKDMVEQYPKILKQAVPIEEANEIKKTLEAAGASVELE